MLQLCPQVQGGILSLSHRSAFGHALDSQRLHAFQHAASSRFDTFSDVSINKLQSHARWPVEVGSLIWLAGGRLLQQTGSCEGHPDPFEDSGGFSVQYWTHDIPDTTPASNSELVCGSRVPSINRWAP